MKRLVSLVVNFHLTMADTNQIFRVSGELEIKQSSGQFKESKALLSFRDQFDAKMGQIRAYGFSGFNTLLFDSSACQVGMAFRAIASQGDSLIGGLGDQFPMKIANSTTTIRNLIVQEESTATNNQQQGSPTLVVNRANSSKSTGLTFQIAEFSQNQWKAGESVEIKHGAQGNCGVWGYTTVSTNPSDILNTCYLGMQRNYANTVKNIVLSTNGDVSIPAKLTAGTVYATTYENLPVAPPPSVAPLTLDAVNGKVGINTTNPPSEALDVVGAVKATGDVIINDTLVSSSSGSPEGVKIAPVGSLYLRKDGSSGTTLYTKVSGTGNTGWSVVGQPSGIGTVVYSTLSVGFNFNANTYTDVTSVILASGVWNIETHVIVTPNSGHIEKYGIQDTSRGAVNDPSSNNVFTGLTIGSLYGASLSHNVIITNTTTFYLVIYGNQNNSVSPGTFMRATKIG